jgi:hypothetical protein
MTDLELTGLDGANPLAFLAALGVLVALDEAHRGPEAERPRLAWRLRGGWRPVLRSGVGELEALAAALAADRARCTDEPALRFTTPVPDKDGGIKLEPEVKPLPGLLRDTLRGWAAAASPEHRRTLDWFTAFISEGAVDGNGNGKPTSLHFTAGQQRFLGAAVQLAESVRQEHLAEALAGPWTYASRLPVMGWDNTETRDYALRATNPSDDKKCGNPGADWLALRGLVLLPTAARRGEQRTPGVSGGWKSSTFTWPLWAEPLPRAVVSALLTAEEPATLTGSQRARRGIATVLRARILRSDQGGYGSVTPSEPV